MSEQPIKVTTTSSKEIYIETPTLTASIYPWGNYEGASLMIHGVGPGLPLRMSGSFTWEELQAIQVALAAAYL